MHISSIGIDLGKTTFHLVALGENSKDVARKKFSRKQLLAYTANLLDHPLSGMIRAAAYKQEAADLVDHGGTTMHQSVAHPADHLINPVAVEKPRSSEKQAENQ